MVHTLNLKILDSQEIVLFLYAINTRLGLPTNWTFFVMASLLRAY